MFKIPFVGSGLQAYQIARQSRSVSLPTQARQSYPLAWAAWNNKRAYQLYFGSFERKVMFLCRVSFSI
jgi:hypothetical protein